MFILDEFYEEGPVTKYNRIQVGPLLGGGCVGVILGIGCAFLFARRRDRAVNSKDKSQVSQNNKHKARATSRAKPITTSHSLLPGHAERINNATECVSNKIQPHHNANAESKTVTVGDIVYVNHTVQHIYKEDEIVLKQNRGTDLSIFIISIRFHQRLITNQ
ncbi:hypothetical protein ScPMuIL_006229 [Solemya velum]